MATVFEVTFPTQLALGLSLSLLRVLYIDPLVDATYVDVCYVTSSSMTAQILPGDVLVDCNGINLLSPQGNDHPSSALHTRDTFVKAIVGAALPRTIRVFRLPGMHPTPTTLDGYAAHTVTMSTEDADLLLRSEVAVAVPDVSSRSRTPLPAHLATPFMSSAALTPLGGSPSLVPGKERYIVQEVTAVPAGSRGDTWNGTAGGAGASDGPGYGFGYGPAVTDRLDQPLTFTQSVKTPRYITTAHVPPDAYPRFSLQSYP
jgi:hypothetical protein